ncbi:hypothetical protein ACHAXM_000043 [Skeletonema potamos]|jgi:hypothetical protein
MCNYVSYYIPAAAVISAFSPGVLKKVYDEDSVAVDFLAVGLGASAVTMVWVPIPVYSEIKDGREVATKELKTCYLIVCFMEKVAIIFVLAALFRFGQAILEMGEEDMK